MEVLVNTRTCVTALELTTDQEVVGSTPTGCTIKIQLVDYSQVIRILRVMRITSKYPE